MNKLVLSILSVTAFATLSSPAQAHDHCYQPDYGYRQSYNYYQPSVRVYRVERPDYYRSYDDGCRDYRHGYYQHRYYGDQRCETHSHHGLHGFFEHLFR